MLAQSCVIEAAWFLGFLVLAAGALAAILSGAWSGPRAKTAWICLGAILILDLGRADLPWIHYFDYETKYSPNDCDRLSHPTEALRTARHGPPLSRAVPAAPPQGGLSARSITSGCKMSFPSTIFNPWISPEMPRMQEMDDAYMRNFEIHSTNNLFPAARLWELTGTRYLIYHSRAAALLNEYGDSVKRGFQIRERYLIAPKEAGQTMEDYGDFTVIRFDNANPDPRSPEAIRQYEIKDRAATNAIIEFTRVLPRAKLYSHWETPPDGRGHAGHSGLHQFRAPPNRSCSGPIRRRLNLPGDPHADAGTVEITDYHSKDIQLRADAEAAGRPPAQ